jgi:hypothetical protein
MMKTLFERDLNSHFHRFVPRVLPRRITLWSDEWLIAGGKDIFTTGSQTA